MGVTRHMSEAGIRLLRDLEAYRANVYTCAGGKPTIGYGHVLSAAELLHGYPLGISMADAIWLLRRDLLSRETCVSSLVVVPQTQNQFDALVCLVFNIGDGAFAKSTVLRRINAEADAKDITEAWKMFVMAGGRKVLGLRRARELALYFAPDPTPTFGIDAVMAHVKLAADAMLASDPMFTEHGDALADDD